MSVWQCVMIVLLICQVVGSLVNFFDLVEPRVCDRQTKAGEGLVSALLLFLILYGGGFFK